MPKRITDEQLLAALLTHGSASKAAHALKISRQAVYERLKDDNLKRAFLAAQGAQAALAAGGLMNVVDDATKALSYLISDPTTPPGTKVAACDSVLRHALRFAEIANLESRISALEQARAAEEKSCG